MICCQACSKTSTLDSRFCRSCGVELSQEVIDSARAENSELIDQGIGRLAEGRVDEAILVAQEALSHDPASSDAYALLGDAYERKGNLPSALEAYEKVVDLNPDSPLDRVKLTYLKDAVAKSSAPSRRKPLALISAAATTVLVMSVGSMFAVASMRNDVQSTLQTATTTPTETQPTAETKQAAPVNSNQAEKPGPQSSTEGITKVEEPASREPVRSTESQATRTPIEREDPTPVAPMRVNGPIANAVPEKQQAKPPTPTKNEGDPDPTPVNSKPTKSNGVIDIKPSEGNQGDTGSAPDGANDADNMMRIGRQHFMTGDYERAADAYDRALSSGADPALVNQRLGQCYEKLGRRSEAITAYTRAAEAYKRRLENGSGDKNRNQAALDACRAALRVLGG